MKFFFNKLCYITSALVFSAQALAYQNTGISGVDETTGVTTKIAYACLFLGGLALVIGGFIKLFSEEKSGKVIAISFVAGGILAWGILALWVSKMSGFSF